jgi:hypothetical protein
MKLIENFRMERNIMLQRTLDFGQVGWKSFGRCAASVLFALSIASSATRTYGQQSGQQTFASPQDAAHAFFVASQSESNQSLSSILGAAGKDIVSSGDPLEDANARVGFVIKYQEMHRFVKEPDGTLTLVVGSENWPLPIPLVNKNEVWYFDTDAGKDEILFRRIGKNELAAMQACGDLVDAQKQYYDRAPSGFAREYAEKLVSDKGRHNGLFWQETADQFDSPINPLIAYAGWKEPNGQIGDPVPFNGYFFRVLSTQGPHAPGGAKSYIVGGKMTAGFAFVAYPAQYRSSGVMTLIVNGSGIVYEKDLGPDTTKLAEAMTVYDPDHTWERPESATAVEPKIQESR